MQLLCLMFWPPPASFLFKPQGFVKGVIDGDANKNATMKDRRPCKGLLRHYRPTSSHIDILYVAARSVTLQRKGRSVKGSYRKFSMVGNRGTCSGFRVDIVCHGQKF